MSRCSNAVKVDRIMTVLGVVLGDSDRLNYRSWGVGERSLSPMGSRAVRVEKGDGEVRIVGLSE